MRFMILFSVNIAIINSLTCDEILNFPSDTKLSLAELQSIKPKDIMQCLAHLSKAKLPLEQAQFIWQSIVNLHGGIENIPDEVLVLLHWVTTALKPEDYANITFNNIDVIQNFGLNYNLNNAQLLAIANRVREDFGDKKPEDYTYYDLLALNQIVCAFNRSEIERIQPSAFREAARIIGKLEGCSEDVLRGFATLAVHRDAFGQRSTWSESTVKILGNVAKFF